MVYCKFWTHTCIHKCGQNLPVGLFSSVRLLLLPNNDRWSCDTEMQLDEEPSPHWWSRVQRQRERESTAWDKSVWHLVGVKYHWWSGTLLLLFGFLCLFSLTFGRLGCPAHIDRPGPSRTISKLVPQSWDRVLEFYNISSAKLCHPQYVHKQCNYGRRMIKGWKQNENKISILNPFIIYSIQLNSIF